MPGGSKPYRARTLGYSPGLELALNICPSQGIALAACPMVQENFASILLFSTAPKNCVVAGFKCTHMHIDELCGKSNRQLGKYPALSATRRAARPCVHVRAPYYPSLFLPSFITSRAAGNIRCRQMP
jgi:hypothetical protein